MNPMLLLLGAGAIWYLSRKAGAAQNLQYYPQSVKIRQGKLYLLLEIVNPSFSAIDVNNVFLNFYSAPANIEPREIGRTAITEKFTINPNGSTTLEIPIQLNAAGLIYLASDILTGKVNSIKMKGTINSMGVPVPVDQAVPIA